MLLSVHVEVRSLPVGSHSVYARLATSAETRYTCRQSSRNPAWPTTLMVSPEAAGNVHLSIHGLVGPLEDGLLGLIVLQVDELRNAAPGVLHRELANGAQVLVRVETVRNMRNNERFVIAATASRLRRRAIVGDRRVPLVLVVFRQAQQETAWVPVWRGAGCSQGNAVFFDDAELDLVSSCLGEPARPIRVALYRIDQDRRFRLVAFFETAFSAFRVLPENRTGERVAVSQPLQGRFYDDQPGNVTFVRTLTDSGCMRVALRFDVFNAPEFISSHARPRRMAPKLHELFDEENDARSRRMESSFSVVSGQTSRVEMTTAYENPPPSSTSGYSRRTGRSFGLWSRRL